jgi:hypothetical protein
VESSCERGNEPSGSIKFRESIEWLHNLWPLEWRSAPRSSLIISYYFILDVMNLICFRYTLQTSTSGGRSVGIVRSRTKGHGVCLYTLQISRYSSLAD